jgi:hypothetical protein
MFVLEMTSRVLRYCEQASVDPDDGGHQFYRPIIVLRGSPRVVCARTTTRRTMMGR